jgi:hypothetical protein
MLKLVRVILGLDASGFSSGLNNAQRTFEGFKSGVSSGIQGAIGLFSQLGMIITGLQSAFNIARGAAQTLWDTFIQGALDEEKLIRQMTILSGSAATGAKTIEMLDDWALKMGVDSDEAAQALKEIAPAIKAADGALDPDKAMQYMSLIQRLSLATGQSIPELSRSVAKAITGDVDLLARSLGISKEALAQLSPEFAKMVNSAQSAGETQLGRVTRLGEQTATIAGDSLKMLDELATGLGANEQALDDYANSTEGQLNTLKDNWDEFTETVGAEFLPIITKALKNLNEYIGTHGKEIDNFVKSLGDAGGDLKSAWDWITQAADAIQKFMDSFNEFYSTVTAQPAPGEYDPFAINENAPLQKALHGEMPTIGNPEAGTNIASSLGIDPNIANAIIDVIGNLGTTLAQNLNIKITIDDEGKLGAVIDKKVASGVEKGLDDLVSATTNKQKPGVQ